MPAVYSTITNSTRIVEYDMSINGMPREAKSITIRGGAGVSQKRTFNTPLAVRTEVSTADLEWLQGQWAFKDHVAKGFMVVVKSGKPEPDALAANMLQRDGSAPIVPNDYEDGKAPIVNGDVVGSEPTKLPRTKPLATAFTTGV